MKWKETKAEIAASMHTFSCLIVDGAAAGIIKVEERGELWVWLSSSHNQNWARHLWTVKWIWTWISLVEWLTATLFGLLNGYGPESVSLNDCYAVRYSRLQIYRVWKKAYVYNRDIRKQATSWLNRFLSKCSVQLPSSGGYVFTTQYIVIYVYVKVISSKDCIYLFI